jgi:tetratricopeptide (TPR) repeat protein
VDRMEEALPVLLRHQPDADLATVAAQLGRLHFFKGHDAQLALQRLETALSIAEPMGFTEVVSQALNTKALVMLYQGRPEESLGLVSHALDVALKNDHSSAALRAYNNYAELLFRRDRYEESVRAHEEGLALARRVGDRLWEHLLLSELTYPLYVLGRWNEALESAAQVPEEEMDRADSLGLLMVVPAILVARGVPDEARQMLHIFKRFEDSADVQERAAYAVARATVEGAEGSYVSAHKAAREAVDLGRRVGADGHMFRMGLERAMDSALALGDLGEVEALLSIVHNLRRAEITPMLRAIALQFRARLDAIAGRVEDVEPGLVNAAALFREIGAVPWLGAVLHDLGDWLVAQGRDGEAKAPLDESRETYERLEAQPSAPRT